MRRHALTLALLILITFPAWAQGPALSPPQGAQYLGPGRMLEAQAPRQLSLNAHVTQFMYQPGGLGIAYVCAAPDPSGEGITQSVRLVGVKRGGTAALLTHIVADAGDFLGYSLLGWTADARYLLVRDNSFVPIPGSSETAFRPTFTCMDVGASPPRLRTVALSLPPPSERVSGVRVETWWSPSRSRVLFEQNALDTNINRAERVRLCSIYDPSQDRLSTFSLPPNQSMSGWLDEGRLLTVSPADGAEHFYSFSIATGNQSETTQPPKMPERDTVNRDSTGVSPKSPALSLDVEKRYHPDKQGVTGINSHLLWVRRAGQPKALSAMPVGLTPGAEDPLAVWSPNGRQIAFLDHGDLWVTDLSERDAQPKEKYLAGETLTCPEEKLVAAQSLKQIGLAILQYAQDNDEHLPALKGVNGALKPYLPPDALLAVGGHPFVYHAPADLSLAAMDSPANTVMGTIDLPCGRVALYGDGHVKNLPAPEAAP